MGALVAIGICAVLGVLALWAGTVKYMDWRRFLWVRAPDSLRYAEQLRAILIREVEVTRRASERAAKSAHQDRLERLIQTEQGFLQQIAMVDEMIRRLRESH